VWIIKGERSVFEPLVYWQCILSQKILSERILIPDDKLQVERAKPFHKRHVNRELECRVFRWIDGIEVALAHWRFELFSQNRDDHEATYAGRAGKGGKGAKVSKATPGR
jgi:hypothetical protein